MSYRVIEGDCVEEMAKLEPESVDAVVCDPPYELGFMGKSWDSSGIAYQPDTWLAALRILKPGGHLLAFGGTRTYHRLACAIEDAGFEIRDSLLWLYGSGFPKSLDVSKAIDKAAGAEREVVGTAERHSNVHSFADADAYTATEFKAAITAPATPEAQQWQGWGTALKPAHEPIVVARKPLSGTVAANVLKFGTGAINVEGCRVQAPKGDREDYGLDGDEAAGIGYHGLEGRTAYERPEAGRWPANVILSPDSAAELDEQSGQQVSGVAHEPSGKAMERSIYGETGTLGRTLGYGDTGGASRFFYCAKASRGERNAGGATNGHPTVKPISLMRWLVRLVTPPGGLVLDPFTGSGTTGCAAVLEDFEFIGIEREPEYVEIAKARIAHWYAEPVQTGLFG